MVLLDRELVTDASACGSRTTGVAVGDSDDDTVVVSNAVGVRAVTSATVSLSTKRTTCLTTQAHDTKAWSMPSERKRGKQTGVHVSPDRREYDDLMKLRSNTRSERQ